MAAAKHFKPEVKETKWCRCKGAFVRFLETTSVKGVSRCVRSEMAGWRVIWSGAVLFGMGIATWQLYLLLRVYLEFQSSTRVLEDFQQTNVPAITVCNLNPYPSDLDDRTNKLGEYYRTLNNLESKHPDLREVIGDLFLPRSWYQNLKVEEVTSFSHDRERLFVRCEWQGDGKNVEKKISCSEDEIKLFQMADFFNCYTIEKLKTDAKNSTSHALSLLVYLDNHIIAMHEYRFDRSQPSANGLKVFVHRPGTLPDLQGNSFIAGPGQIVSVQVDVSEKRRLKEPYGKCTDVRHLDLNNSVGDNFRYSMSGCRIQCPMQAVMEACDCVTPMAPVRGSKLGRFPYCAKLARNLSDYIEKKECARDVLEGYDYHNCHCPPPCQDQGYSLTVSQAPWPSAAYHLSFYDRYIKDQPYADKFSEYEQILANDSMRDNDMLLTRLRKISLINDNFVFIDLHLNGMSVTQLSDTPSYSPQQLLASIGGAMNLWIGITWITLVEVAELIYYLCRIASQRRQIVHVDQKK